MAGDNLGRPEGGEGACLKHPCRKEGSCEILTANIWRNIVRQNKCVELF